MAEQIKWIILPIYKIKSYLCSLQEYMICGWAGELSNL